MTELCEIGFKYGTDKCPQVGHGYTPFYYELLKNRRQAIKKVLEIGIGSAETMKHVLQPQYVIGASLRMWRDFFPNAWIYGVDLSPSAMFEDERITTLQADTRKRQHIQIVAKAVGYDTDLIIDDGSHSVKSQIRVARMLKPLFNPQAVYAIEDSKYPEDVKNQLPMYDCDIHRFSKHKQDNIIIVKNK